ncbi:serine hydrolase [Maribacter sp. PR1]|uniref:Serine hydrolase n=1 Tax=Maribacter cobaltidurans TaxID=1178778 RepID=A0ABU7IUG7_9FLAO|nr:MULTISPECIES: serine hydrolase [Maribacter]MDC6389096.1 serine hydrolase [Maribacter sp. PR1]MEE1976483.1 serine hydrolase [Maribacter cobaltidurans]
MNKTIIRLILILTITTSISCHQNKNLLNNANPTEKGFSQSKLDSLGRYLEDTGSEALMILTDGKIVYDWGNTDKKLLVHSIRKALLNSLYGIYIENGTIDTTMTIGQLKIDDINPLTEIEKTATIADLLKSRSGIYHNAAAVSEGMLASMPERGIHKPNEAYYYNNWDFNTLGYILEKQTGKTIFDLFNQHIARPLGMDYSNDYITVKNPDDNWTIPNVDGFYQFEEDKSKYPAYHFRLSAKDLALYGQLYLNRGEWNGKQIIPKKWIELSTKPYSITNEDYGIGYGMLWNVLIPNENRKSKSFFHTGVGIHMLGVYPESNLVLIHRVDTEKEYEFHQGNFYQMISKVWDSKEK